MDFVAKHKPLQRHNVGCQKSEKTLLSRSKGVGARITGEPVSVRLLRANSERQSLHCYCNAGNTKINLNTVLVVLMHLLYIITRTCLCACCHVSVLCIMFMWYSLHLHIATFTTCACYSILIRVRAICMYVCA